MVLKGSSRGSWLRQETRSATINNTVRGLIARLVIGLTQMTTKPHTPLASTQEQIEALQLLCLQTLITLPRLKLDDFYHEDTSHAYTRASSFPRFRGE